MFGWRNCVFEYCSREALFAFNLNQQAIYCYDHREPDTILVTRIKCNYLRCKEKIIVKEDWKDKKNFFCEKHSLVTLSEVESKSNNRCKYGEGCRRIAKYSFSKNTIPLRCDDHKNEHDVYVTKRKCKKNFCGKRAEYAFPGSTSMYCKDHYKENMIDVHENSSLFTKSKSKSSIDNAIKSLIIETNENNYNTSIELKELFYT
jgi:hypothetical protein